MVNILVILGPTGVGKTELSLRLAEHYGCPIINADSRQIYRDLPIGTAAPTAEQQARVKHYFVGTHDLEQTYNAGQFARDVRELLEPLALSEQSERFGERVPQSGGKGATPLALLSGGSMMYIDAVCHGLDDIPDVPANVRERVRIEYKEKGLAWLQSEVAHLDPIYWAEVDQQNPQRLLHCLEVTLAAGQPYSTYRQQSLALFGERVPQSGGKGALIVGLMRPREELYARINARVDQMMADGLLEEARAAYGRLAAPTVGYRELFDYFEGKTTLDEAVRLIKQNSRHYAKRQMTWWRRRDDIHWLDASRPTEDLIHEVDQLL